MVDKKITDAAGTLLTSFQEANQAVAEHLVSAQESLVRNLAADYSLQPPERKENNMAESVYKVIALVGTSNESWEKAAATAIERASQTLRDLRVARIVEQDVHIEPGKPLTYRVKVELSFKYEGGS